MCHFQTERLICIIIRYICIYLFIVEGSCFSGLIPGTIWRWHFTLAYRDAGAEQISITLNNLLSSIFRDVDCSRGQKLRSSCTHTKPPFYVPQPLYSNQSDSSFWFPILQWKDESCDLIGCCCQHGHCFLEMRPKTCVPQTVEVTTDTATITNNPLLKLP